MTSAFSVGLTGGVGSGKSTIAAMLAACGAGIVDADAISHELTQAGGAAVSAMRETFGERAITADGSLDRAHMRTRAFSEPAVRLKLESLLHPLIRTEMDKRAVEMMTAGSPYIVFVIPLLVESGSKISTRRVLLIDCSEATQLARVRARPGISDNIARNIVGAQATRQQRLALADDVLMNEAPLAEIQPRVELLHRTYLECARSSHAAR